MSIELRITEIWNGFPQETRKDSLKKDYGYLLQI